MRVKCTLTFFHYDPVDHYAVPHVKRGSIEPLRQGSRGLNEVCALLRPSSVHFKDSTP